MSSRVDPFTGKPLEIPNRDERPYYEPTANEPEDDEDMRIERLDQPSGFIHTHDRQRGARFRMSMAIPVIMVGHLAAVMVGVFAIMLGVRGSLGAYDEVLVPALVIGGSLAAVGGTLASLYIWPATGRQGPLRTITYGLLASAFILGFVVLGIGLVFSA